MNRLVLVLAAMSFSGCGFLIDGAYLLSGKQHTKTTEQRRPTGESETRPEVRFVFEGPRVRVACENVTRGIDRVWTVDKTYEYQGGYHRAHLLPVILDGVIGGILGVAIAVKCNEPGSNLSCNLLYGTIPFGVDFTYSFIRLFTTEPAKLVNKQYGTPRAEPHDEPIGRAFAACPAEARVQVSSTRDTFELEVPPNGELTLEQQQRIVTAVAQSPNARVIAAAPAGQRGETLQRCEFLKQLTPLPMGAANCLPQQQ